MNDTTILIASFNNEEWIDKAINSAQKQTVDCNICVVDDGSSDQSLDKIKETLFGTTAVLPSIVNDERGFYSYKIGNNTLVCLDNNNGPSFARNIGIEHTLAETKYYAILDADDEMYSNKVKECLNILESDENISVVYADYDIFNTFTGNTLREYKKQYSRSALLKECIIHSGSVIRSDLLKKIFEPSGWYDINLRCCEDWDLWLRITERGLAYHIPKALTFVRSHKNDSTNSVPTETWQKCWKYVAEKTGNRLQNANKNK